MDSVVFYYAVFVTGYQTNMPIYFAKRLFIHLDEQRARHEFEYRCSPIRIYVIIIAMEKLGTVNYSSEFKFVYVLRFVGEVYMDSRHKNSLNYSISIIKNSVLASYIKDVFVYGSCGRGNEGWESDVDVLIILYEDAKKILKEESMHRALRTLLSDISPADSQLPETDARIEFEDVYDSLNNQFYKNVKKDGVSVWQWI